MLVTYWDSYPARTSTCPRPTGQDLIRALVKGLNSGQNDTF